MNNYFTKPKTIQPKLPLFKWNWGIISIILLILFVVLGIIYPRVTASYSNSDMRLEEINYEKQQLEAENKSHRKLIESLNVLKQVNEQRLEKINASLDDSNKVISENSSRWDMIDCIEKLIKEGKRDEILLKPTMTLNTDEMELLKPLCDSFTPDLSKSEKLLELRNQDQVPPSMFQE